MRRLCATVALAMLLGAACSSSPDVGASGSGTTGSTELEDTKGPADAGAKGDRAGSKDGSKGDRTRTDDAEPDALPSGPGERNTMPLTVTLNTYCAHPGQQMIAEIETLPNTKLGFAVVYSGNSPPDFTPGTVQADADGRFTWTWVVRSAVREGDALMSAVATKGRKGASYDSPFRISLSC